MCVCVRVNRGVFGVGLSDLHSPKSQMNAQYIDLVLTFFSMHPDIKAEEVHKRMWVMSNTKQYGFSASKISPPYYFLFSSRSCAEDARMVPP